MSRLDEVEATYDAADGCTLCGNPDMVALARALATEVDARDEVITKLLAEIESVKGRYFGSLEAYSRACEIAGRTE